MTVSNYFTRLKELWEEYSAVVPLPSCKCDSSLDYARTVQQQRLFQFLMGLNSSYQHVRSQILLMSPLPTVNQAYSLVCQEEMQRNLTQPPHNLSNEGSAMTARGRGRYSRGRGRTTSSEECTYCHRQGHKRDNCYQLVGFPPSFGRGRGTQDRQINHTNAPVNPTSIQPQESQLLSQQDYESILKMLCKDIKPAPSVGAITTNDSKESSGSVCNILSLTHSATHLLNMHKPHWLLDSGATTHVVSSLSFFDKFTEYAGTPIKIRIPNGEKLTVTYVGSITLFNDITLENVLYAPGIHYDLVSVSRLTSEHTCVVAFFPDVCVLQDLYNGNTKTIGKIDSGLYIVEETDVSICNSSASSNEL